MRNVLGILILSASLVGCSGVNYVRNGKLKKVRVAKVQVERDSGTEEWNQSTVTMQELDSRKVKPENIEECDGDDVLLENEKQVATENEESNRKSLAELRTILKTPMKKTFSKPKFSKEEKILVRKKNAKNSYSSGLDVGDILYLILLAVLIVLGLIFEPEITLLLILGGVIIVILAWLFWVWLFGLTGL